MSRINDNKIKYRLKVDIVVKAKDMKQVVEAFHQQAMAKINANVGNDPVNLELFFDASTNKPVLAGQFDLSPVNHCVTYDLMGMPQ